jgi:hypothetical protein
VSGLRIFLAGYFASMATGALILGDARSAAFGALFSFTLIALGWVNR